MINSVSVQTYELLSSALLGVGLGVMFDIMRVIRSVLNKKRVITILLDVVFWLVAIIALLAFVLTVSGGKMRWYVLVGTFCGAFVYMSALSEIIFKVFVCAVLIIRKTLFLITHPMYLILRRGWRMIKNTGRKTEIRIRESVKQKRSKRKVVKDGGKKAKKA